MTQFERDCEMRFEIIPLSESYAKYKNEVPDKKWIGEIAGVVNGWQFEYADSDGHFEYSDVFYRHGTVEDEVAMYEAQGGGSWRFEIPRWKGYEPTGRVVFRGYGMELWDADERDWYIEDYEPTVELSYIVG